MAKYFKALAVLFTFLPFYFFTLSCQEGHEAGDLLGQWRLSGSDECYLNFSGSVTLFRHVDGRQVFGNFQHVGDSIFMQCYSAEELPTDTILVEEEFGMKPFRDIRLRVEALSSGSLVLSKGQQTWSFTKY